MANDEVKRIGEVIKEDEITGEYAKAVDMVNVETRLEAVHDRQGKDGVYIVAEVVRVDNNTRYAYSCGGAVIVRKFQAARDGGFLPLLVKLIQKDGVGGQKYFEVE